MGVLRPLRRRHQPSCGRPRAARRSTTTACSRSVREALGDQLRGWLVRLSTTDPQRLAEFLSIHHLGVKALALHDDEMLRLVERWWPMETNVGRMTLAEFRERYGVIRYSATDRPVPAARRGRRRAGHAR